MNIDEIKQALREKGITQAEFAQKLCLSKDAVNKVLNGRAPLTDTLKRHIELLLFGQREALLVYRVDVSTRKVEELTAGKGCVTPADHHAAMQAIAEYNLRELEKIGAGLDWTEEERRAFGLPAADWQSGDLEAARQEPYA